MWKTTDRYVQQKRVKAVEAESKLKQVYIPSFTKEEGNASSKTGKSSTNLNMALDVSTEMTVMTNNSNDVITVNGGKPCESCSDTISPHVSQFRFEFV